MAEVWSKAGSQWLINVVVCCYDLNMLNMLNMGQAAPGYG